MKFAGSAAMRDMDAYAIQTMGIPSPELMLNAASGAAEAARELLQSHPGVVQIFCGSGNNGGDGIAVAALLMEAGYTVRCFMVGNRQKMTPDACLMEQRLLAAGGVLEDYNPDQLDFTGCSLIVDAIFGTGLSRVISGRVAELIDKINASQALVLACDISSGISADTGEILGSAVQADVTVTFNLPKTGQLLPPGTEYTGKLIIHDIGIPEEAKNTVEFQGELVTADMVARWLPEVKLESHKGDYGKLLLLCGSTGFTGAAAMASRAALRSGAGLVFLGVPENIYPILAGKLDEPVVFPLPAEAGGRMSDKAIPEVLRRAGQMTACLFGPGVGVCEDTGAVLASLLHNLSCPAVLDADALTLCAADIARLKTVSQPLVLTPHEGEFCRIGGDLSQGRISGAAELAKKSGAVVVLKGYRTVIASPDGRICVNSTGNPGMAVGGSGDVLAGILTCLLGQGMPAFEAAAAAVYIHGAAGDFCAARMGTRSMLPTDMIEVLPEVFRQLNETLQRKRKQ